MAGLVCQCGKFTIHKCPECDDSPLCVECLQDGDMCESCRATHNPDDEDDDTLDMFDGDDDEDDDDGDDDDDAA